MPRRRHESLGDMISTVTFFGVSLTLALASVDSFLIENYLKKGLCLPMIVQNSLMDLVTSTSKQTECIQALQRKVLEVFV